ncbi:MAG TPA: lysophospholipase [Caulobacteraceae bacterium]|jgi:alpha-beta hydrolase superfamily lysophospholipase|nr:lysophospholipase [Caulobacteraceae bacterium]
MRDLTRRATLSGLVAVSACAPTVQKAGAPPLGFPGPRIEPAAFVAADGTRLPLDVWAAEGEPWAVMVALHGMNDYANAFAYSAPWWASQGITTYAYDQRGFGRAPQRGLWGGTELMTEDLRTFAALVRARHPNAVLGVLGHSMGGAVAIAAFASDRPPVADRLILAAPAVWGWSRQALPNRIALWTAAHIVPASRLSPPDWLARRIRASDNIEVLRAMGRDPNMIFSTRIDAVYGLVRLMQQADKDLAKVRSPTLYLCGAKDQIIPRAASVHAARGLKRTDRSAFYPDGWHLLTRDLQGPKVWADIAAFLKDVDAPLPSGAGPMPRS